MERGVRKSYSYNIAGKREKTTTNKEDTPNPGGYKREVNSWDSSTPTSNGKVPRRKISDWDSGSECQETIVEPFETNDNPKDSDNWDSESGKDEPINQESGNKHPKQFNASSLNSEESLSVEDLSCVKSLQSEIREAVDDGLFFAEDFKEFVNENGIDINGKVKESPTDFGTDSEKAQSIHSENTHEDTTVWMIPKSGTQSRGSSCKSVTSREQEKTKNESVEINQNANGSNHSIGQKNHHKNFFHSESSNSVEIDSPKAKASRDSFDKLRVHSSENEHRTAVRDSSKRTSPTTTSLLSVTEEVEPEDDSQTFPCRSPVTRNANVTSEAALSEMARAGTSTMASMDVSSLPDMIGRKSFKERRKENISMMKQESSSSQRTEPKPQSLQMSSVNESWLLLDDRGQYRAINRNVVSILLNGRSADAVLQGRKEHFISNVTLRDSTSLRNSLSNILTKESFQHVLKEEDLGGEDDRRKVINLERKVENTLFYIQPGMNHTASVRIIPMDTEMIHEWRRTRDGGSTASLEVDLMNSPRDSMDSTNHTHLLDPHSSRTSRPLGQQIVSEEDESQTPGSPTVNRHTVPALLRLNENEVAEYSKMLFETRKIVDSLTNSFKTLQNRLDGETNRNTALEKEVNKLKVLMKSYEEKLSEKNLREHVKDTRSDRSNLNAPSSLLVLKDNTNIRSESIIEEESYMKNALDFEDKSTSIELAEHQYAEMNDVSIKEDHDIITVNIYTVESKTSSHLDGTTQEIYSVNPANLRTIDEKIRNLQKEKNIALKQNLELKKKLKEISIELEKYLSGASELEPSLENGRELETSRDQVCKLKFELENLKTLLTNQKKELIEENSLLREEFRKIQFSITTWEAAACELHRKIATNVRELQEQEIPLELNLELESDQNPKNFTDFLASFVEQTSRCLSRLKNENYLLEQTLKEEDSRKDLKEISGLDQVISGYSELIEQCRKGQITSETQNKVVEDYFAVIMEKASLMEEVKILKTENEMLLEGQLEHYEKLKQTMIALKDRKSEVNALESSQKLLEEERATMEDVLNLCEEEKKTLELEIMEKSKTIQHLMEEIKKKDLEMCDCSERLNAVLSEIPNFEDTCRLKDDLINELKTKNEKLLAGEGIRNNQMENLKDEIKNLQMQGAHLEAELASSRLFLKESQKEMTEYITHLEALLNNSQESLEKLKLKLKESSQTVSRLKSDNDVLDKRHQCDVKLFNNTKDELDSFKEKLVKTEAKLKESEGEREKLHKKCQVLSGSDKEKSEALEVLRREYKTVVEENAQLSERVAVISKDKDESLKEQKDLINKYAMLSKEIQKLQDKYRTVKSECKDRTDLIKYLEMMLRDNLVEYNKRIACLEQHISQIIEKIAVCKNGMREKHFVDEEVRELRRQLNVTCRERKEMEKVLENYYSLTKHLEHEIEQRERKVDELHAKLSQKPVEDFSQVFRASDNSFLKLEHLEKQLVTADCELAECKKELQRCQNNHENEKKKLELIIADLKSEIKRYQLRTEVMMRNLSNCSRSVNGLITDKRNADDSEIQAARKELQEKTKQITELNDTVNRLKAELRLKESDLENSRKRTSCQDEEVKNLQNQISQIQEALSAANGANEVLLKEKEEMAEKLFQSIKLIMEEKSARQSIETLLEEKEKNCKDQIEEIKNELVMKVKELEIVSRTLEEKKKLVNKLQDDLRKMKAGVSSLKDQVSSLKRINCRGDGDSRIIENPLSNSPQNVSSERLESCLKELKEIRDVNLQLRKTEGQYQAKIIRLEDEIRDARLLIKELQGDIKTEKKSKKAFKNMITAAKMEIEKCVLAKQLMSVIAERISRHLDLSEIPSREFLSGFRLVDSSSSSKSVPE